MPTLNTSDYKVLNSILDLDTKRGLSKLRGTTIIELSELTGYSTTKVRNSIKILKEVGFVDNAVKRVRAEAYHITPEGLKELEMIGQSVIGYDPESDLEQDEE
jgi:predicted transcriptional regulator